jgi:hypothetical protein
MKKLALKSLKNQARFALAILILLIAVAPKMNAQGTATKEKRKIQIALILDTSGSMDGLIEQAKSQLWTIVNELTKASCEGEDPILEIALYEYGNDRFSSSDGWVRQIAPLITDLDDISSALFAMTTNGGSEYCGLAIEKSTKNLEWSKSNKDIKMIFIAGNEPFTQGPVNYLSSCGNAREKGIMVNTIHCGSFEEGVRGQWKNGALVGGGEYMSIEHNKRTVYIETPYDDQINKLGADLNKTYIYYGEQGYTKKQKQTTEDANAQEYSSSNIASRNSIKASKYYKAESWDLVDALEGKKVNLKEVKKESLPPELQKMTDAQLQAYVDSQSKKRENLKLQISVLDQQRKIYIAKQSKSTGAPSLESSMVKAIKKQAVSKNYTW